jgi:hypothetical protein
MKSITPVGLLLLLSLPGCAGVDRYNSNCEWPRETPAALDMSDSAQRQHLSDDAHEAEDLAIRYADAHNGIHSGHFKGEGAYSQARDQCMAALLGTIATTHGVTEAQVREGLTQRREYLDVLVILSFAVLYGFVAGALARRIWQRFPPDDGWIAGAIATLLMSTVVSAAGLFLGEIWSGIIENIRVGNGHLSYRLDRIPWTHHRFALFIGGLLLFWLIAAFQYRRHPTEPLRQKILA